ncbi:LexA family transcriptional regulator [Piscirickettsia litoralis]|uniref:Helix-turn-helix type 11 domain-containing protein n=1 Tax=Piscirickettsia litoralis TaxID=1891921 RepID=A0ABX3A4T0_9GAMM|nr:hypothetical protein [Piscirickettsia litoralis]ODN41129.1 hypothetical protein BGC07_17805 [Piscirickettsia litoralis]
MKDFYLQDDLAVYQRCREPKKLTPLEEQKNERLRFMRKCGRKLTLREIAKEWKVSSATARDFLEENQCIYSKREQLGSGVRRKQIKPSKYTRTLISLPIVGKVTLH